MAGPEYLCKAGRVEIGARGEQRAEERDLHRGWRPCVYGSRWRCEEPGLRRAWRCGLPPGQFQQPACSAMTSKSGFSPCFMTHAPLTMGSPAGFTGGVVCGVTLGAHATGHGSCILLIVLAALFGYGRELVTRKRREPGDDLISPMCAAGEAADGEIAMLSMARCSPGANPPWSRSAWARCAC